MTSLLVFLALVFGVAGAVAAVVVVGAVLLNRVLSPAPRGTRTLPSHYTAMLQTSSAPGAGFCPHCETNNGPKATFCSNCSARLPTDRRNRRPENANEHLLE